MFDCKLFIPFKDPLVDPSSEGFSKDGVDYINHILTRHFPDLPENGEAYDDSSFAEAIIEDTIQRESLILGDKQEFHLIAENGLNKS
jgi:hypothetical protein